MPITEKSDRDIKLRKAQKKLGDLDICAGLIQTQFFKKLLDKQKTPWYDIIRDALSFSRSALAYSVGAFWKVRWGKSSTGFLHASFAILYLLTFNSEKVWSILSLLCTWFVSPFVPLFVEWSTLHDLVFVHIRSTELLNYAGGLVCLSLVHTICIQFGFSNKASTKRGDSILYLAISRWIKVPEFTITLFEITCSACVGYGFWEYWNAPHLALHLWIGCLAWLSMDIIDEVAFRKHKSMMIM